MLITNLNKVRQLSQKERRLLFQSVLLLPIVHVALILFGYSRLRRLMEKLASANSPESQVSEAGSAQRAREVARIVSIGAQQGVYRAGCLRKSLVLWWFLRREEIPTQICFGVRMYNGKLEAHAWVERKGVVLNDPANIYEQYHVLQDALPPTSLGL